MRRATALWFFAALKGRDFYPRSPCGERLFSSGAKADSVSFLSTLSLRRATESQPLCARPTRDFYPRSPCGERPTLPEKAVTTRDFYPRSPCGERLMGSVKLDGALLFLSTLSLRRATTRRASRQHPAGISIHALLAESDPILFELKLKAGIISIHALLAESDMAHHAKNNDKRNFYPRSPCGERPVVPAELTTLVKFLSTLSLRRATRYRISAR